MVETTEKLRSQARSQVALALSDGCSSPSCSQRLQSGRIVQSCRRCRQCRRLSRRPPVNICERTRTHPGNRFTLAMDQNGFSADPMPNLFDEAGRNVGSHFAGPSWRWLDGSQVTGKPISSAAPNPDSIPWLLLTATGHTGNGVLTNISSIQRLQTKGGKAPASGCAPSDKGEQSSSALHSRILFLCSLIVCVRQVSIRPSNAI